MLASGHKVECLEGEEMAKQSKDFHGYGAPGLVRLNPGRWLMPKPFTKFADKIYSFEYRESDVVLMTYPKCGTTWMQEIVWTMRNNPDLNNPLASVPVMIRSPFVEFDMFWGNPSGTTEADNPFMEAFKKICPGRNMADGIFLQLAECIPDPRTIKTHLPFSMMPPSLLDTTKVVYVARNPKDMVVSYHHHSRIIHSQGFDGTLEDFVQYFVDDDLVYGPYWLHLKEAWEKREHPNLHIVFFEDLKVDPLGEMKRLDTFLGTKLTQEQLQNVVKYTNFAEMKKRGEKVLGDEKGGLADRMDVERIKKDGGFFRKGETGDWKRKLTPEQIAKIEEWTKKNMKNIGIDFKYSI